MFAHAPPRLRHSALTTATLAALPLSACSSGSAPPAATAAPAADFFLHEATLADLQAHQQQGRYSSRQLTELYLKRIAELNQQGPTLRAVLVTN